MEYKNLYNEFVQLFPDDEKRINEIAKNASAEQSDGMHIMFGMVVIPYLIELLKDNNKKNLTKAFCFFEKMAETNDNKISEVLEFTILENIISCGKNIYNSFKPYMGKETLNSCLTVEKYLTIS